MGEVVRLLADANAFLTKKIEVRGLGRTGIESSFFRKGDGVPPGHFFGTFS